MTPRLSLCAKEQKPVESADGGEGRGNSLSDSKTLDIEKPVTRHNEVRNIQEFISDIRGYRTRWPILIAASLLTVCLVGFSISRVLLNNPGSVTETSGKQAEGETDSGGSCPDQVSLTGEERLAESQPQKHAVKRASKMKKTSLLSFQSEAEAAVQIHPQLDALKDIAAGDGYMEIGEYSRAIAAYERALSIDRESPGCSEKLLEAKKLLISEEVHDLLSSVSQAVENENMDLLLAFLDDSEPRFFRKQELKAKMLFSRFDQIDGTYSEIRIRILDDDELAVKLHCNVKAAFASSGRPIVLFDGNQDLILRKVAGAVWKICQIDD